MWPRFRREAMIGLSNLSFIIANLPHGIETGSRKADKHIEHFPAIMAGGASGPLNVLRQNQT
jgi:hypothetical protein